MRAPQEQGSPRARASQILEMLIKYQLIEYAWFCGDDFTILDHEHDDPRHLSAEEVLDEYGDRIAGMATAVMEHSELTTTQVSVPVGRAEGPVPYLADVGDRVTEYQRFWV